MLKKKKITDIKKPKKRIKSIWVVLLTSLVTILIVGGGFAGFIYWQNNFARQEDKQQSKVEEDKIEGKNAVVATSNNGNIFVNFYSTQYGETITKKIATEVTVQGGKWEKDNKNEVVQFSEDGQNFIALEVKESSLSDKTEFARLVKYSKDGKEKDVVLEDKNSLAIGNFVYSNGKVYYIYTSFKGSDIDRRDLYVLDTSTKKTEVVVKNIGDTLEKELTIKDNKIYSLYVLKGIVYESVIDIAAKTNTKNSLFKATKTKDFELLVRDIYLSQGMTKYIYKDYTQKDGYQLKLYDKATKKTSLIKKDKENSLEEVIWKSDNEIVFKKKTVFSSSSSAKESIVSMNINDTASEKSLLDSDKAISIVLVSESSVLFSEGNKMYMFENERKDLNLLGFVGTQDTLFAQFINY